MRFQINIAVYCGSLRNTLSHRRLKCTPASGQVV